MTTGESSPGSAPNRRPSPGLTVPDLEPPAFGSRRPDRCGRRVDRTAGRGRRGAIPPEVLADIARPIPPGLADPRSGDAGVLPVVIALIAVTVVFTIVSPNTSSSRRPTSSTSSTRARCSSCSRWARASSCCSARSTCRSATSAAIGGIVDGPARAARVRPPVLARDRPPACVCGGIGLIQGSSSPALAAGLRRDPRRLPDLVRGHDRDPRARRAGSHHQHVIANQQALYGLVYATSTATLAWLGLALILLVVGGGM